MNQKLEKAFEELDNALNSLRNASHEAVRVMIKLLEPCGECGCVIYDDDIVDDETYVVFAEPNPLELKVVTAVRYWNGRLEVFVRDCEDNKLKAGKWCANLEDDLNIDIWFLLSELRDFIVFAPGYEDEIKPYLKEEDEEIFITPKGDREICVDLHFADGLAKGDYVTLMYPKIGDLTPAEIKEIDEYTGGRLSDSGCITPYDVALKFGEIICFGIMDTTNGHSEDLVRDLNRRWVEDKEMFKDILCALYHRDIEEIRDSDTYNWGDKRIADICIYMYEHWADEASNYLQHIADDQDLEAILMFVRYDRSEH